MTTPRRRRSYSEDEDDQSGNRRTRMRLIFGMVSMASYYQGGALQTTPLKSSSTLPTTRSFVHKLEEYFERPGLVETRQALDELDRELMMMTYEKNSNKIEYMERYEWDPAINQALEAIPLESRSEAEKAVQLLKRWAMKSPSSPSVTHALRQGAAVAKYMAKTPFGSDGAIIAVAFLCQAHKLGGLPAALVETQIGIDSANLLTSLNSLDHLTILQRSRWDAEMFENYKTKTNEIQVLESCRLPATHATNLRQMLVALATDFRSLPLLLVRRLISLGNEHDNIDSISLGRDALDVYAPLAERFGLYGLKSDLEDEGFRCIAPNTRAKVVDALAATREDFEIVLNDVSSNLRRLLQEDDVLMNQVSSLRVSHRLKAPWSIWKKQNKLQTKMAAGELIQPFLDTQGILYPLDTIALRVILDPQNSNDSQAKQLHGEALCRRALELVHDSWPAVPDRIKDYIMQPKKNGYQSLHTTVMMRLHGVSIPFEVQIRTKDMHSVAEFGEAAHVFYSCGTQHTFQPKKSSTSSSSPPPFRSVLAAARQTRRHFHRARAILAKLNDEQHDHIIVEQEGPHRRRSTSYKRNALDTLDTTTSLASSTQHIKEEELPFQVRDDDEGIAAMTGAQLGTALGKRLRAERVFVLATGGRVITFNADSNALDVLDALQRDLDDNEHASNHVTQPSTVP